MVLFIVERVKPRSINPEKSINCIVEIINFKFMEFLMFH